MNPTYGSSDALAKHRKRVAPLPHYRPLATPSAPPPRTEKRAHSGKVAGRCFSGVAHAFATPCLAGTGSLALIQRREEEEVLLERAAYRANDKGPPDHRRPRQLEQPRTVGERQVLL